MSRLLCCRGDFRLAACGRESRANSDDDTKQRSAPVIYFPQLSTGCIAQLPLQKSLEYRTVTNALPSGKVLRATDSSARRVRWSLNFRGLTDAEWKQLLGLFAQVVSRLRNSVFLDPASNLLQWS